MQAGKTVQDKPERNCHDPAGQRRCTGDDTCPAALDLDDSIARRDREGTAQREKSPQSKNQIAHFFHLRPSNTNRLLTKSPQPKSDRPVRGHSCHHRSGAPRPRRETQPKIPRTVGPANRLPRQTEPFTYEAPWP